MESLSLETGPSHALSEWEAAAAAVLRKSGRIAADAPDAEVWAKLAQRTLDGIEISPLGTPALTESLTTMSRPSRAGAWQVCAAFEGSDAVATGEAIRTDLENGVNAVWLTVGEHAVGVNEIGTALSGVLLDAAPVILDAPGDPVAAAEAFAALVGDTRLDPGSNLGADPVGAHIRRFNPGTEDDDRSIVPIAKIADRLGCRAVVADGTVVHDRGASDAQELAYVLEVATTYLRILVDAGFAVDDAAALIDLRLAATDEQFPTIAKLRAVRRLWSRVLEVSGVSTGSTTRVHAVTSRPMMNKYDPWVNMLRTCVAAFAAGVGGADMVTVLPFDARLGLPDAFSRRIARNTSALLIEEAHVAVVADPAGGSHLVEKLTDDLAVAAWAEFTKLDVPGGLHASSEAFIERIAAVVAERSAQIAKRTLPITGVSEFPNLHEALPERQPYPADRLEVASYAHAFEALRDEPVGKPVFLATMGTVAAHTARATFAGNLFAAGGIDTVNEGVHDDIDAVLAHYRNEPVVCLVGNDAAYAEWGTELANRLRGAGASWVIVAGKPLEGCDDNCAMGVDALDFLTRTREKLA